MSKKAETQQSSSKTPTKIISCSCEHHQQDLLYGVNRRLANRAKPNEQKPRYRCTVCSSLH